MSRGAWLAIAAVVALLALGAVLRPSPESVSGAVRWLSARGAAGAVVFALAYAALVLLLVPGSVVTLLAGFVYGAAGLFVVWPGAMAGGALAFLLGRRVVRSRVEARIAGDPRLTAVDRAVAADGFRTVLLLRLSPVVPFSLLNYVLGATRLPWRTYLLASGLGILPGTLLYVLLGAAAPDVVSLLRGGAVRGSVGSRVLLAVGLLATLAVTWSIGRRARAALREVP